MCEREKGRPEQERAQSRDTEAERGRKVERDRDAAT